MGVKYDGEGALETLLLLLVKPALSVGKVRVRHIFSTSGIPANPYKSILMKRDAHLSNFHLSRFHCTSTHMYIQKAFLFFSLAVERWEGE